MTPLKLALPLAALSLTVFTCTAMRSDPEVAAFLADYERGYQPLYTAASQAEWLAGTDVRDAHTEAAIAAGKALSAYTGDASVIQKARGYLDSAGSQDDLQERQLRAILLAAAENPGTIPEIVSERVEAEARQRQTLDGFTFRMAQAGGGTVVVTPNQIDQVLDESRDLDERRRAWEAAKSVGPALKDGLIRLRGLRNRAAREMGHDGYFALQVADYGMTTDEMMTLLRRILADVQPLYDQVHLWARRRLAQRYGQPVPERIPAHWIGNRWGQEWPGLVDAVDLDPLFAAREPGQLIRMAEDFYVSLGFPRLPASFYEKSDLYELPPGAARKKNTHASAWHIDLDEDVRSLMSVRADFNWFTTTHHELGHIYYYMCYSRPEVPLVLREGANRSFHEGIGELISLAASQQSYLRDVGVLGADQRIDSIQWLLNDAMSSVVFLPWSAGVMSHFEHDLYEEELPPDQWNARWWKYVREFQGIEPAAPRGEEFCDAATKTHVNDDPAGYYDYALATVLKFQLHDHIARKILHADPRDANYRGNEEVGRFLKSILALGATRDWRSVLKETTGEDLSGRAMLEYFAPLQEWLEQENAKG